MGVGLAVHVLRLVCWSRCRRRRRRRRRRPVLLLPHFSSCSPLTSTCRLFVHAYDALFLAPGEKPGGGTGSGSCLDNHQLLAATMFGRNSDVDDLDMDNEVGYEHGIFDAPKRAPRSSNLSMNGIGSLVPAPVFVPFRCSLPPPALPPARATTSLCAAAAATRACPRVTSSCVI